MSASLIVRNVSATVTQHIEFETTRAALQEYALGLLADLLANPEQQNFHVQIQRMGAPPPLGTSLQIQNGDTAKITTHPFPFP